MENKFYLFKYVVFCTVGLCMICTTIFAGNSTISIIPQPVSVQPAAGKFYISSATKVFTTAGLAEADYLVDYLHKNYNLTLEKHAQVSNAKTTIELNIDPLDSFQQDEGYSLNVSAKKITISASSPAGIFYGIQTLLQLLAVNKQGTVYVPGVMIVDAPQYKWRGMHLDCSRHFFSKDEVKKYLDYMARYKFNTFHWHLTDDQGWRIEIKKYPLLTSISSMRKETLVGKPKEKDNIFDGKSYGGYYTQQDVKEIVAYAEQLHITIVPEIEMPGHSVAALSAYPQYSCTGGPFQPMTMWGVSDDVYCSGNDSTYAFLENILTEVCALFPGKYFHIGGDECPKVRWKSCSKCQARMKTEHLQSEEQLQSYFVKRIENFLATKGKLTIGWDEIMEGGLPDGAIVMSWRGTEGGIAAAKQKHYAVMTPGKPCYFDHYQSKNISQEPLAIGGYNSLADVYNYNPSPDLLLKEEKKYILGAQGNVWTEYMASFSQVQYMIFPRMCALSEVLWSRPDKRNYPGFIERLRRQARYFNSEKINYNNLFLQQ